MKKVIISACLLGELCRYDGKTKQIDEVIDAFKECEIIPFCPEAPLFGTPRERINVVEIEGQNRIITDKTKIDVTDRLKEEIYSFIKDNPHADMIVLKSKSPSCGMGSTPILNGEKEFSRLGNGIAADIFLKEYKDVEIVDELSFIREQN